MRIEIEHVSFSYEPAAPALRAVDLSVATGASVALIGPNGSGKSTLLRVASGVLRPDSGVVRLEGRSIAAMSGRQLARHLAMVEQERPMGFDFTVREVVAMGRIPYAGRFTRESGSDRRAIEHAMDLADIGGLADRSIRAISGGERQRVYLGMALAQQPEILLLDEPTTHLDLRHQVQFMSIVRQQVREGMTAIVAIHDLTLAAAIGSHCCPKVGSSKPAHRTRFSRAPISSGSSASVSSSTATLISRVPTCSPRSSRAKAISPRPRPHQERRERVPPTRAA